MKHAALYRVMLPRHQRQRVVAPSAARVRAVHAADASENQCENFPTFETTCASSQTVLIWDRDSPPTFLQAGSACASPTLAVRHGGPLSLLTTLPPLSALMRASLQFTPPFTEVNAATRGPGPSAPPQATKHHVRRGRCWCPPAARRLGTALGPIEKRDMLEAMRSWRSSTAG